MGICRDDASELLLLTVAIAADMCVCVWLLVVWIVVGNEEREAMGRTGQKQMIIGSVLL